MKQFHFAFQVCDKFNKDLSMKRFCGDDRNLLSKKSITSFFTSLDYLIKTNSKNSFNILIVCDNSSDDIFQFVKNVENKYANQNVTFKIDKTNLGAKNATLKCFDWLMNEATDYVFSIHDDYIFLETALYEIQSIFNQIVDDYQIQPLIVSSNYPHLWFETYRSVSSPRLIVPGEKRYWIQSYDTPTTFFTSKGVLERNIDLIESLKNLSFSDAQFEKKSLNKMFKRGIFGFMPLNSLSLHMQEERDRDPYIKWEEWWNNIDISEYA